MGYADSTNLYQGFGNNPANMTDPLGLTRKTAHGGENYVGDFMNDVDLESGHWYSGLKQWGTVAVDATGNTISELLLLDTIADATTVSGDSSYSTGERAWAGTKGAGAAAFDLVGGRIVGAGTKKLLASRPAQWAAEKILGSKLGTKAVNFLLRDVRSFVPRLGRTAEGVAGEAAAVPNRGATPPTSTVSQNSVVGQQFDDYVAETKLKGLEDMGQLGRQERLPTPDVPGRQYVQPDYTIYNPRGYASAYADAKTGASIPFDAQAQGLVNWAETTTSKTLVYYTPQGITPIDPRLMRYAARYGVRILQVAVP